MSQNARKTWPRVLGLTPREVSGPLMTSACQASVLARLGSDVISQVTADGSPPNVPPQQASSSSHFCRRQPLTAPRGQLGVLVRWRLLLLLLGRRRRAHGPVELPPELLPVVDVDVVEHVLMHHVRLFREGVGKGSSGIPNWESDTWWPAAGYHY